MDLQRRRFLTLGATVGLSAVGLTRAGPASANVADGAATQMIYLSGTDADSPVPWDFMCTAGRRKGVWGTVPTPSNWEFSGYGTYNYGGALTPGESGKYRHTFTPPTSWAGRQVFLVFEGAMTDTTVLLNSRSAGPKHQGAFYRFRYDVTSLIRLGQSNLLEVTVDKDSAETSVNQAEREGDYWAGASALTGLTHAQDGSAHTVTATYSGDLRSVRWRLDNNGWLRLDYTYGLTGTHDFLGVNFDYPESKVTGATWLGRGPYRVWKNRLRGVTTDVWHKSYNDTATGKTGFVYPEFKGYHAGLYWVSLLTTEGGITMVSAQENVFLRLFTPAQPADSGNAAAPFPGGNLSFLDGIPAIGNKFHPATSVGPAGQPNTAAGTYARTLYFRFGN
ncbi:glycosyl hydrolase 2 galactose-binding domain-containing protein [Streptomyces sp. H39-S7]|uniref:glycosyl hydrolase 2 galactose-binding domain-containing protein n=1 Tax=Streptomyces sp. H39-S7 TaxID=3004357 RepID=UPI0022AFAB9B|nr:sugar-binding domain-containing protein [Streptomyces sp. H39-S7]MCZ4125360.1 hypothetical protein [Streptomyces sp. H39-S7]